MMTRTGECIQCGECCGSVRITSVLSIALKQHKSFDDLILYYSYHHIQVVGFDNKQDLLFLEINLPCKQLDSSKQCQVHDKPELKPLLCQIYPDQPDDISSCGFRFSSNFLVNRNSYK